jgi:putative hydrolase of the HAD superfamily
MIKTVIFDAGEVLVSIKDYRRSLAKHLVIPFRKMPDVYRDLDLLEKGAISTAKFREDMAKMLGVRSSQIINEVEFAEKNNRAIAGTWKIVARLRKKGYRIAMLSNVAMAINAVNARKFRWDMFHHRFLSCYVGIRKPDPRIFKHALEKIGVRPEEAVFIDDVRENIVVAKKLGINAIHFRNPRQLERELKKIGVL